MPAGGGGMVGGCHLNSSNPTLKGGELYKQFGAQS